MFPSLSRIVSSFRAAKAGADWGLSDGDRLENYRRWMRAYRGWAIRAPVSSGTPVERRRLRHNFNRPIVNLGAAFAAAMPLKWDIPKNSAATQKANDIWDRSGSDRTLLRAMRCAGIHGDIVGLATQDPEGRPKIEFVCADIAYPTFDGSDQSKLVELEIAWTNEDREGRQVQHREFYSEAGREVFLDGSERPDPAQSQAWDALPAVWVRNLEVMGMPFGFSDLDGVTDLVEEYDHVASKQTRAIDYYAGPTIVCRGVKPGGLTKDMQTVIYVPENGDVHFLEWTGPQPGVDAHLSRLRNDLSEVSQVPAVAFGRQDSGLSQISGVALRILYGPLLAKTQEKWASWSPALEYLMWLCLQAEGQSVDLEQVNVKWTDPLPKDALQDAQAEKAAVESGLRSQETAIGRLGSEDPKGELKKVQADQRETRLTALLDAGVPLLAAAQMVGYGAADIEALTRTDFPAADGVSADGTAATATAAGSPGPAAPNGRLGA
jgi:SPP1 family phage portal protein